MILDALFQLRVVHRIQDRAEERTGPQAGLDQVVTVDQGFRGDPGTGQLPDFRLDCRRPLRILEVNEAKGRLEEWIRRQALAGRDA